MQRIFGLLKVMVVIVLDYIMISGFFKDSSIGIVGCSVIAIYVFLGGYISLLKEGAVSSDKLPSYDKSRFHRAKNRLVADVKSKSGLDIARLKLYLVPSDDTMNATAYGCNCVSVTQGTLNNVDPITLNAVLAHEVSHIINFDAEFQRAVFCTVTLLIAALSFVSFAVMIFVFILFLVLSFFRSWLGLIAFRGTTKLVSGVFGVIQRSIVMIYRSLLALASRHAEYRCDLYACSLGYGIQLAHFLSLAEPYSQSQLTLTEALYRSHPPTPKRIARLEAQCSGRR